VPEFLVDLLEAIEIDQDKREFPARPKVSADLRESRSYSAR
jgi:hypothetical protein